VRINCQKYSKSGPLASALVVITGSRLGSCGAQAKRLEEVINLPAKLLLQRAKANQPNRINEPEISDD
jgi:hypothetical protein